MAASAAYTLILIRHGESQWNQENRFTGWVDCPLAESGIQEAVKAGQLLKAEGFGVDQVYTSVLKRAIKTTWQVLEQMDQCYVPVERQWRLNERHYGALQGLNKKETVDKHGAEKVQLWRRSYDNGAEFSNFKDPQYAGMDPSDIPSAECLKDTVDRVMPLWESTIVPMIKSGKRVMISAHGNSLRALVKHLDNIPPEVIAELNIPTAVPLIYKLDADLRPIKQELAWGPLSGAYLGDQDEIRARIEGVAAQTAKK